MFSEELARQILNLHFAPSDRARYEALSEKAQQGTLSNEEQVELDDYLNLNDFFITIKAKAEASLRPGSSAA